MFDTVLAEWPVICYGGGRIRGLLPPISSHMTAIKKNTSNSTKSSAPATKTAKPTATKTAVRKTKVAPAAAPVPTPAPAPVAAVVSVPPPEVELKVVTPKPVATTITARIDVGFGNSLHVRGDGPGLSWDRGVPMTCIADDQWQLVLGESARPFTFKIMVNDLTWCLGDDYTLESGGSVELTPEF